METSATLETNRPTSNIMKTVSIPSQVLQELIDSKTSGRLTIQDPSDESVKWRIYLSDGRIHFASSAMGQNERIPYLLKQSFANHNISFPSQVMDEYQFICSLWKSGQLSAKQVRHILVQFTQEAITQFIAFSRASIEFERTIGLNPLLLSLPLKELILSIRSQVRYWIQLKSEINSPFDRIIIQDLEKTTIQSWINPQEQQLLAQSQELFKQNLCLYQIANKINKSNLELALLLQPLVKAEAIKILRYESIQEDDRPLIACIDDSQAIQRTVKMTLESSGFRVLNIIEPAKALTTFVRQKPDLILMDITMPEIDGHELCRMLQQSNLLKDIPIIMLTGRDGLIDRIRSRMAGAVSYISKPFKPQELIDSINSHLIIKNKIN